MDKEKLSGIIIMNQRGVVLLVALFCVQASFLFGQSKEIALYSNLTKIKLLKSQRKDVEKLFKYTSVKESKGEKGFQSVYYDFDGGNLSVDLSTGKCSEHLSSIGYDVERGVVVGWSLYYFKLIPVSKFPFDLTKFQQFPESDNDSITYRNKKLGIEVTGGRGFIYDIEYSLPEKDEEKYRCDKKST